MARNDGSAGETPLLIWIPIAILALFGGLAAVWLWGCDDGPIYSYRVPTPPALHMEVPASPPVITSCIGLHINLQYAHDPWKFAEMCQTHTDVEVDLRDGTRIRLDIDEFERRVKGEP